MTRKTGGESKNLGRRAFGTSGGGDAPGEPWERFGEVIDLEEEILRRPIPPVPPIAFRARNPRAGRIYNFPVSRIVEEK